MKPITSFHDKYRFLSNFYPVLIKRKNLYYRSVEHAYQATKTLNPQLRKEIAELKSPGKAKRMGARLVLRPHWDLMKLDVMKGLNRIKFQQIALKTMLLSTGDTHLEEGNKWGDTFWGTVDGKGENHLGKILMEIRSELAKELRWEFLTKLLQ